MRQSTTVLQWGGRLLINPLGRRTWILVNIMPWSVDPVSYMHRVSHTKIDLSTESAFVDTCVRT